ncbi:MAG: CRISPR system precrRNA processing endoribonuclease RAMP protein Cas6 [bacterium]
MPLRLTLYLDPDSAAGEDPASAARQAPAGVGRASPGRTFLCALAEAAGVDEASLLATPRPFTLSPLLASGGDGRDAAPEAAAARGAAEGAEDAACAPAARFRLGVSWLADPALPRLLHWCQGLSRASLSLEVRGGRFLVRGAAVSSSPVDPWTRLTTYARLFAEASDSGRSLTLKFCSPTLLERAGAPYPLPDPTTLFTGYLESWNAFSGIPLCPRLPGALAECLRIIHYRIRALPLPGGQSEPTPGFRGSASFRLEGRHAESTIKGLNVLADFSLYCGTGVGTDQGMGMTRRIFFPASRASTSRAGEEL